MNEVIYIGNYIHKGSQCGIVISKRSNIFATLSAGNHGYSQSNILEIKKDEKGKKRLHN